jgi:hypothetical protein
VIGSDDFVYSTTWSEADGWAPEWFHITTENIFDHATQKVTAISSFESEIELYVVGSDDRVWVTFWSVVQGWQNWHHVPGNSGFDHTKQLVSAVARMAGSIDLFMIGVDGNVWSTARSEENGWLGSWFKVGSGPTFDPSAPVTAISRAPDKLARSVRYDGGWHRLVDRLE